MACAHLSIFLRHALPSQILDFQIDDIVRPANLLGTEGRLRRTKAAVQAENFRRKQVEASTKREPREMVRNKININKP
jgi:hypothetical protein